MTLFSIANSRSVNGVSPFVRDDAALASQADRNLHPGRGMRGMLYIVTTALALSFIGRSLFSPKQASDVTRNQGWTEILHPLALYSLDVPEFGRSIGLYRAQRLENGQGRIDYLTVNGKAGSKSIFALVVKRLTGDAVNRFGDKKDFYAEAALLSAKNGFVMAGSSLPTRVETRFGSFDVADVRLDKMPADACRAFQLQGAADFQIAGFACSENAKLLSNERLACELGRLDLRSAGDDEELRQFFINAEDDRRRFCETSRLAG